MLNSKLQKLPLGDIIPQGWLRNQLRVQADGLTGNVMNLFKDLSENSAWLGGNGESWERGPYYVDGLMPLAYLLDDEKLKDKAKKWLDSIFSSQNEEGFFGPKKNLDWWPRMVVTKMLPSYFEVSKDERVIPFLTNYYTYMNKYIDSRPLYSWANARGIEELIGIDWLYSVTKKKFLQTLGNKIIRQSLDWGTAFEYFNYTRPTSEYMSGRAFNIKKVLFYAVDFINNFLGNTAMTKEKMIKRNDNKFNRFYHLTHGVNIAMALKYPALIGGFMNKPQLYEQSKTGYKTIMKCHGTANGLFTCDEHLSGAVPTQGTELCTVAEAMFSFEKLYETTADNEWADLLELLAFSTYPATFTEDMCSHQYVQQVNQISATTAKRKWYDSYNKANIYGLKPNYACCLANMHQGFPKLCEHLAFIENGDTLTLLCPVPMAINTKVNNVDIALEVVSDYPFKNTATVTVTKGELKLKLRIPENAKFITVNGEQFTGNDAVIEAKEGDIFNISYEFEIVAKNNEDNSVSYYYGNLLLALPILATVTLNEKGNRYSDREMEPASGWNYAPSIMDGFKVIEKDLSEIPFSTPPVSFKMSGYEIPAWKAACNQAGEVPKAFTKGAETVLTLVPYGATDLRIAQFPKI